MNAAQNIVDCIERCLLPKLTKNYDEKDDHIEYLNRHTILEENFNTLMHFIKECKRIKVSITILSSMLILNKELQIVGNWNLNIPSKEYIHKLNELIQVLFGDNITVEVILQKNNIAKSEDVFDDCMSKLHRKLTCDKFKQYPSLVGVYCDLIGDLQKYEIEISATCTLPISVLLIDDYNNDNKIRGLKCCKIILEHLNPGHFQTGNYYEILFETLMRCSINNDLDLIKLTSECLMLLIKVIPQPFKVVKLDLMLANYLQELHMESNLYRKAQYYDCMKRVIDKLGINSTKRKKMFNTVLCDSLDVCCNESVWEILLHDVLQCLEVWTTHCWCSWQLSSDKIILSKLLKVFYIVNSTIIAEKIRLLFIAMISLCKIDEINKIFVSMQNINNDRVKSFIFNEQIFTEVLDKKAS